MAGVLYIIERNKCKKVYIEFTQALYTRISFHKSNIKVPENRKINPSKHLYEYSNGLFKTMQIYQTDDYTLFRLKEKT